MLRFSRLRTRLAVLYAGLFAAALIVVAAAVQWTIVRAAESTIRDELTASGTVFDRIWALRSSQLRDAAGLLSRDFGFRAAVATKDAATIHSALDNLRRRLGIRTAFIVDIDGNVTGIADARVRQEAAALWSALDEGAADGVVTLGGTPYQAVAAPIMMPTLGGWVVFASELDRAEMARLEGLAAIPIKATVLRRIGPAKWVGDVPGRDAERISRFVEEHRTSVPDELNTSGGDSIALTKPLKSFGGGAPTALLLRYPMALALAPYRPMQIAIILVGLSGLGLLIIGSWRLSETITRPISRLDEAARQLERGDEVTLDVKTDDEIGRLADSFRRMAQGIAERERRITHLAFHDTLTGLPNRVLFREQLDSELRRRGARLAVLSLNLDKFALVNDTLGHQVGDALLKAVADRLHDVAGDELVAGFGGDEFAVMVEIPADDPERPGRLALQLLKALETPLMSAGGQDITVGASAGIAISPGDGEDAETLIKNAGLARARAKADGRGTVRFFETEMDARAQARRTIEFDLRNALERRELELHFQPLYDLRKDRITGFESLIRWRHPTRGMISPIEFIPVAEETGLIVPMGEWIFQEACRQAMTWPGDIRVAVNVSPVQFASADLEAHVLNALEASGLDPQRLEVEITESIFLGSSEETLAILHRLRSLGCRTSLDDFGTGYSSLSYLLSYPFDKVKIDQSFVRQLLVRPGSTAIVRSIVTLAEALGMDTIAEGVEDRAQFDELRAQNVGQIQGYLISRPLPADQLPALFERARAGALVA